MAIELLTFDADGDLLLIVSRPGYVTEDRASDNASHDIIPEPMPDWALDVRPADDSTDAEPEEPKEPEEIEVPEESEVPPPAANFEDVEIEATAIEVHMLVSAKHLMLASPVFHAMLQRSNFKEGKELMSNGKVTIPLPDDDVAAFTIILNIIHARNRRVPRTVSLDTMTQVSIITDKYQLFEVLEAYGERWIKALTPTLPQMYETEQDVGDVHKWAFISWTFEHKVNFASMTALIEASCYGNLTIEEGLPFPETVMRKIGERRQGALSDLFAVVEEAISLCQQDDGLCHHRDTKGFKVACDAMLLGSIIRAARLNGLYPSPPHPYSGLSVTSFIKILAQLDVFALCDVLSPKGGSKSRFINNTEKTLSCGHGIKELIIGKAIDVRSRLSGLNLRDFKRNTTSC